MAVPLFDSSTIRAHVHLADLMEPVAQALTDYSQGKAGSAPVSLLHLPAPGEVHIKSAHIQGHPFFVIKIATSFPTNRDRGLTSFDGTMLASDAQTGKLVAILHDESYLTDLRTAVAGALAAQVLAPQRIGTVGVMGTGVQARLQVQALALVRRFERVLVWGRDSERAQALCEALRTVLQENLTIGVISEQRTLVEQSDLVITATASREPLIVGEWLRPGQHITAIGGDDLGKRELDGTALQRADRLIVDSRELNLRLGDVQAAIGQGTLTPEQIHGELGDILAGTLPGRLTESDITIAKLVGIGVQDLAAVEVVLNRLGFSAPPPR